MFVHTQSNVIALTDGIYYVMSRQKPKYYVNSSAHMTMTFSKDIAMGYRGNMRDIVFFKMFLKTKKVIHFPILEKIKIIINFT